MSPAEGGITDIGSPSPVSAVRPVTAASRETKIGRAMTAAGNEAGPGAADSAAAGGATNSQPAVAPGPAEPSLPVRPPNPDTQTGPSPAFSTTPLELDGYLQIVLTRPNVSGYSQVQSLASDTAKAERAGDTGIASGSRPVRGVVAAARGPGQEPPRRSKAGACRHGSDIGSSRGKSRGPARLSHRGGGGQAKRRNTAPPRQSSRIIHHPSRSRRIAGSTAAGGGGKLGPGLLYGHCLSVEAFSDLRSLDPSGSARRLATPQATAPITTARAPEGPAPSTTLSAEAGSNCGLSRHFTHETARGPRTIIGGKGALAYRTNYAVNTDGAPNSYHPDAPWGDKGLAINTICDGANAVTAAGETVDYWQCRHLVGIFKARRDAGWPAGGDRIDFYGAVSEASWGPGARRPCPQASGPHAGAMVSSTSLMANTSLGRCNHRSYTDALAVPFIVVPGRSNLAEHGMALGDLAVVLNPTNRRMVYTIVGDIGP